MKTTVYWYCLLFLGAQDAYANKNCPPVDQVRGLSFITADGAYDIWDLYSTFFRYENQQWQVHFTVYLPEAKNSQQAIKLGDDFYRYRVDFFDNPLSIENENCHTCYYAQLEATYFVRAKNCAGSA